jgi:hypothetical protein
MSTELKTSSSKVSAEVKSSKITFKGKYTPAEGDITPIIGTWVYTIGTGGIYNGTWTPKTGHSWTGKCNGKWNDKQDTFTGNCYLDDNKPNTDTEMKGTWEKDTLTSGGKKKYKIV